VSERGFIQEDAVGGHVQDAERRQEQQPLLGGLRAKEELSFRKQALEGLGAFSE